METKIVRLDDFGRGIAYLNDKICFVENALPEEVVQIEITKEMKKYSEAKVLNYIKTSPKREHNTCPYFSICGGCNLCHLNYVEENNYKEEKIKNLIKKFSNLDKDLIEKIAYHSESGYRNKIVLHGKNQKLGLYKKESNEVVEIKECLLVNSNINELIKELNIINRGITKATIKTSNDSKKSMVKINGKISDASNLKQLVDVLIVNDKLISASSKIITSIGNKNYYESITSFFQINTTLTEELYDEALRVVKKTKPRRVLDLYCGVGTIGIYVSDYCDEIIGIDYNESNIKDANDNKKLNNTSNVTFICDKAENKISSFKNIDLIIVDPPRAGLDSKTKEYMKKISPNTIIYISCDPVTLMRDLDYLKAIYQLKYLKPFNMFPKTHHVECVALLQLK